MAPMRTLFCLAALCFAVIAATSSTVRPSRRPVGALSDVDDVNSEHVQNAIDVGADHLAAQPGNPCRAAYSVTRVQQQVVSGVKYRVTLRTNEAACGQSDAPAKICTVDVVVRSWVNSVTPSKPRCRYV